MSNKKYIVGFAVVALFASVSANLAFAQDATTPTQSNNATQSGQVRGEGRGMMGRGGKGIMKGGMQGVFGTVSAVNGNTITVSSKQGFINPNTTSTTSSTVFTVDATNAKIMKAGVASTVSGIVVGDTVMVQGTVTGTNVVATMIRDGQMLIKNGQNGNNEGSGNPTLMMTGNGQPVVAGKVSVVSGNTITISNASNVTYTVDATNAKFVGKNVTALSNLKVGDMVIAQGTVNGNAVVATTVIDQGQAPVASTTSGTTTPASKKGFFSGIGSFFGHLFGF